MQSIAVFSIPRLIILSLQSPMLVRAILLVVLCLTVLCADVFSISRLSCSRPYESISLGQSTLRYASAHHSVTPMLVCLLLCLSCCV
jgi:hypothetical protein